MHQGLLKRSIASTALCFGVAVSALIPITQARAAAFATDFNSGLPAGSTTVGSVITANGGVGNSGVLRLNSIDLGGQNAFYVTNLANGPLTNFQVNFRLALGGGGCCGLRMADGMAFAIGNDLNPTGTFAEEGANSAGHGLIVTFDTWDNNGADTAPAIELRQGDNTDANNLMFQSMSSYGSAIREGGRPDAGPVLTNSAGQQVPLFTLGPAPAVPNDSSFVNVSFELFPDNTFSLSYSNVVVWNHVPVAYNPITGSISFGFGSRVGGANEDAWVDNLQIFANFTAGAAYFVTNPGNQTVTESQTATFTAVVDGTPPYSIQWYSNSVPIAGANGASYTTPVTTTNMNGTVYSATVTNGFGGAISANATLTVNPGLIAQRVTTDGFPGRVRINYNKAAALTGNYSVSGGVSVSQVAYGASHSEVLLTTTPMAAGTPYNVTITGEMGEDATSLVPNPTVLGFTQIGAFCADFTTGLAPNATLFGVARMTNDTGTNVVIHLTDDSQNTGVYGQLYISNMFANSTFYGMQASWRTRIGGGANGNADGMSFNFAPDIPASGVFQVAEDGVGSYLSFTIDTWDQGAGSPVTGGPDTGIEIKWRGSRIAFMHIPRLDEGNGNFIAKDVFVNTLASVDAAGNVSFTYDTNTITGVIPNWTGVPGGSFNMAGRTGGEADNHWIDDLCVSNFTIGAVAFVREPSTTTALEFTTATFYAAVDGSPTYYYQWFTNGMPVAGATNASYTTAPVTAAMEGTAISVTVSNLFSSVTSSNAILHVNTAPRIVNVRVVGDNEFHVLWTRAVELFEGTYSFDNGIVENLRDYGTNHAEIVILTDPLTSGVTYTFTAENVVEEGNFGNSQFPNPDSRAIRVGYASFCTDFSATNGVSVIGNSVVSGGILHVTDAVNSQNGGAFIPAPNGAFPVDRLVVKFRTQLSHPTPNTRIADGMSLNIASDIGLGTYGEEGAGNGLRITFDTWDNAGLDTAPAIEVWYKGATIATRSMIGVRDANRAPATPLLNDINGNPLSLDTSNQFANVLLIVGPDGKLDMYYKDYLIFQNVQLPSYTGFQGANLGFGARTGGANENAWIDDICINAFTIGAVQVTQSPTNVVVPELRRTKMSVGVNGLPPYGVQWYSNNVAIPGANALVYDTPSLDRNANNAQYRAVVTNSLGAATSTVAIVTIVLDNVAPTFAAEGYDGSRVYLRYSEPLSAASALNAANYTFTNGVTVTNVQFLTGNVLALSLSGPLNGLNVNRLFINGVADASTYNVASTNIALPIKTPVLAAGPDNLLVVEAEDYDVNRSPGPQTPNSTWVIANSLPGFSGTGYVSAEPNTGAGGGDAPNTFTNASGLDYFINFPVAGRYYMWARGSTANDGGNNSFHFTIDNVSPDEFTRRVGNRINNWGGDPSNVNKFGWVNDANGTGTLSVARIDIATPGTHVLSVWMREDGFRLDKMVLTTNASYTLTTTELGPSASGRASARPLNHVRNGDGSVLLTWGSGWRLQATDNITNAPAAWLNTPYTSPLLIPPNYFGTGNTNVFFRLVSP